jgi:hypothetical protein
MNTCEKSACISPEMNTYKIIGLKVPLESTLTKKPGGGTPQNDQAVVAQAFLPVRPGRANKATRLHSQEWLCYRGTLDSTRRLAYGLRTVRFSSKSFRGWNMRKTFGVLAFVLLTLPLAMPAAAQTNLSGL